MPRGKSILRRPDIVDAQVGANIRARRIQLGISQERLAETLGLTFQQVQKYERGTNRISASRLHQISLALDLPIADFFAGVDHLSKARQVTRTAFGDAGEREALELVRVILGLSRTHRKAVYRLARALARSEATEAAA